MTVEKEMFLGDEGKQVGMEMIECQMAVSSIASRQPVNHHVCWWSVTDTATCHYKHSTEEE